MALSANSFFSHPRRVQQHPPYHDDAASSSRIASQPRRGSRNHVDSHVLEEWAPARPREPTNYSAATLENARYCVDGIPTSDHPNEDRHFALDGGTYLAFGVFDGHDGPRVAGFASNYLMELFNTSSWKKIAENQDMDMIGQAMGEFFKATEKDFFKSISRSVLEKDSLQAVIPSVSERHSLCPINACMGVGGILLGFIVAKCRHAVWYSWGTYLFLCPIVEADQRF